MAVDDPGGAHSDRITAHDLARAGLGLERRTLRHARSTLEWLTLGERVAAQVAALLDGDTVEVEHVGSTAVPGLLAKPIIDLAVGTDDAQPLEPLQHALEPHGWIYRGDAGEDDGGHLFVLESTPRWRVVHLHIVRHDSSAWRNYLALRDLLRNDSTARASYEEVKLELAAQFDGDRVAYTEGKSDVIRRLLTAATGVDGSGGQDPDGR